MFGTDFFFLRPGWLLLLIPAAGLVVLALRQRSSGDSGAWRGLVDAHLLAALSVGGNNTRPSRILPALLGLGLAAAILAMAGPTWQKIELPSFKTKDPTVVVLSLAQSMNANDVKPTRLTRAGHKVRDILERMDGGDVGLVVYSDRPFTAAPLTEDSAVIREMLPELSTSLMPVLGNRADRALTQATALLKNAGAAAGRIVLIADGPGSDVEAAVAAAKAAEADGYEVDVLAVGEDAEATMLSASGRAIAGADGKGLSAGFDPDGLRAVAAAGGGRYVGLTAGSADVAQIVPDEDAAGPQSGMMAQDLKADGWNDMGYWLLIVPILLAPLAFRRNVLMGAALALLLVPALLPGEARAADLADLWKTPDQQGAAAFEAANYEAAAAAFDDAEWRASAHYRAGDYGAAAAALSGVETPDAAYNRGNALAKAGELEAALEAYDASLAVRPDDEDTKFNRDLVARLLEEQKQQQEQEDQQKQDQQQQQDQQQNGEQNQDQQSGDGKDQQQAGESGEQGEDQQQAGQSGEQQGEDQQQAGQSGEQQGEDQQQAGESGEQQGEDQQQAGESGEQQGEDQQQAGESGEQQGEDQQQAGENGEQQGKDQQQAGESGEQQGEGQQQADQQAREAEQQQAGQQGEPQEMGAEEGESGDEWAADTPEAPQEKSAFQKAMDALLRGNAEPSETEQEPEAVASSQGLSEREQANEQLLRRVPDDASGLLRARIMQNYRQTR